VDCKDLTLAQKERLLSRNAIDFFGLKSLPQPKALRIARQSWENGGAPKAANA
jgi:hypothetical protein